MSGDFSLTGMTGTAHTHSKMGSCLRSFLCPPLTEEEEIQIIQQMLDAAIENLRTIRQEIRYFRQHGRGEIPLIHIVLLQEYEDEERDCRARLQVLRNITVSL